MQTMIAKFSVTNVIKHSDQCEELQFAAVTSKPFDANGASEDNDFARWSPSGSLSITVTNPNLIGKFKPGKKFYLNFTEAAE